MDGYAYEKYVAMWLKKKGYRNVQVTKKSNDYGVDIIAYKNNVKYAVQCKYYGNPVGVAAIQEVVAGKAFYNCQEAIVVTNSKFTDNAVNLAQKNGVKLCEKVDGEAPSFNLKLSKWQVVILVIYYIFVSAGFQATKENAPNVSFFTNFHNYASMFFLAALPWLIKFLLPFLFRKLFKSLENKLSNKKAEQENSSANVEVKNENVTIKADTDTPESSTDVNAFYKDE